MEEVYTMQLESGNLVFAKGANAMPAWALTTPFNPAQAETGVSMECRMGDPDLVHCAIFRQQGQPGGIFLLYNNKMPLFAALAETDLVYAAAAGYFGQLTASVRYGVDVFENMEIPND